MPWKNFTPSELTSSDVNTYLMNQSVMTFTNATQRASQLTFLFEGMISYLEDTNKTYQYDGTNWLEITKLDSAGRYINPTQPSVRFARSAGHVSATNVIVGNAVAQNIGAHYSTSTGRFTCPVTGCYLATGYAISNATNALIYEVRINNLNQISVRNDDNPTTYGSASIATVLYCQANDYITFVVTRASMYGIDTINNNFSVHFLG